MSCRHQSDIPSSGSVFDAPCSAQRWRRWPNRLPRACNDNPSMVSAQFRILVAAGLGTLLTLATAFGALMP